MRIYCFIYAPLFSGTQTENTFFTYYANWCNELTYKSVAPTWNLQDIKKKHTNQPTKKRVTPCYFRILPLLSTVVRNKSFSKMHTHESCFVQCWCGAPDKGAYYVYVYIMHTYIPCMYNSVPSGDFNLAKRPNFSTYGLRNKGAFVCGPCHSPPETIHMRPLHTRS